MRKATVHVEVTTEVGREDRNLHFDKPKAIHAYFDKKAENYVWCSQYGDGTWNICVGGVNLYDVTDEDLDNLLAAIEKEKEKIDES
jgi:hypothetical protein